MPCRMLSCIPGPAHQRPGTPLPLVTARTSPEVTWAGGAHAPVRTTSPVMALLTYCGGRLVSAFDGYFCNTLEGCIPGKMVSDLVVTCLIV